MDRCVFLTDETGEGDEHLVDRLKSQGARTLASLRAEDYSVRATTTVVGPRLFVLPEDGHGCSHGDGNGRT